MNPSISNNQNGYTIYANQKYPNNMMTKSNDASYTKSYLNHIQPTNVNYNFNTQKNNFNTLIKSTNDNININTPNYTYSSMLKLDNKHDSTNNINNEKNLKESGTYLTNNTLNGNVNSPRYIQRINLTNSYNDKRLSVDRLMPKNNNTISIIDNNNQSTTISMINQSQINIFPDNMVLKENNRLELDNQQFNQPKKIEMINNPSFSSNPSTTSIYGSVYSGLYNHKMGISSNNNVINRGNEYSMKATQSSPTLDFRAKFQWKNLNMLNSPVNNSNNASTDNLMQNLQSVSSVDIDLNKDMRYILKQQQESLTKKTPVFFNKSYNMINQPKLIIPPQNNVEVDNQNTPNQTIRLNNFFAQGVNPRISDSKELKNIYQNNEIAKESIENIHVSKRISHRPQSERKNHLKNSSIDLKSNSFKYENSLSTSKTDRNMQNKLSDVNNTRITHQLKLRPGNENLRNSSYIPSALSSRSLNPNNVSINNIKNGSLNVSQSSKGLDQLQQFRANQNTNNQSQLQEVIINQPRQAFQINPNDQSKGINIKTPSNQSSEVKDNRQSPSQSLSLNSLVTKVNKGDLFDRFQFNLPRDNLNNNEISGITPRTSSRAEAFYNNNLHISQTPMQNQSSQFTNQNSSSKFQILGNNGFLTQNLADKNLKSSLYSQGIEANNPQNNISEPKILDEQDQIKNRTPNQNMDAPTRRLKLSSKESMVFARSASIGPRITEEIMPKFQPKYISTYYMPSLEKYHKNPIENDYFCQIYREHFRQTFQALKYCKSLKPVDPKILEQKKVFLPKRESYKDKKTIVFDLDETLIHCNESLDIPCDVKLPIKFPHGDTIEAGINIRPYAIECLKELSQFFEIIVFTASHGCYANVVLDYLDPTGLYIHHRLFRDSCVQTEEGVYIKDLRVLDNRKLNEIVLVDNAAYSFGYQIENGIPIIPFYTNKNDEELKSLVAYLKYMNEFNDLRDLNRLSFKLHMYNMFDDIQQVLEKVIYTNNL